MKNIHYHSDCPFFAGCENMLLNFFTDKRLTGNYNITFSYRYSEAYDSGFKERNKGNLKAFPLELIDKEDCSRQINEIKFGPLRWFIKRYLEQRDFALVWNIFRLKKLFKELNIDVLHINNGGYRGAVSCNSAIIAAKLAGIKKIIYVVNNIAYNANSFSDRVMDRLAARWVNKFITGSNFAGDALKRVLKLPDSNYLNINNGIRLREITESKDEVLKRLNVEGNPFVFGVVAILEERKGHIYLLEAIKLLVSQGKRPGDFILLIEGNGDEFNKLNRFVNDNNLKDFVKFIGNEANVFNFMNAVDSMVLPSINQEDFPNVVIEAMGLGKAVIASRIAGVPEQIDNLETGIIVEPKNVVELAEKMNLIMEKTELYNSLSLKAKEKFLKQFTVKTSVSRYLALYEELLTN